MGARRRFARLLCAAASTILFAACAAHRQPSPHPVAAPPNLTAPYAAAAANGETVYRLDPQTSQVLILVDKAGALSAFGHLHVIAIGTLRGFAFPARNGDGRADLAFPVRSLVVDPPAARSALGGEYAKVTLDRDQREGTRKNMLGPSVLDAADYPWAMLTIFAPAADTNGTRVLTARITLRGVTQRIRMPADYKFSGEWLSATGDFKLMQSQFGILPYSALLGALRVKDAIGIRYHLVFKRWCPSHANPPC